MERSEIPQDPRLLGVPLGASKMISEPMVCLAQTMYLGVQSGASKMIFEPMVSLAQTMLLSCIDTNTVSKQKEVRFHMTHVT
jgi:hypothetical protein